MALRYRVVTSMASPLPSPTRAPTYAVSGEVTNSAGKGIAGVAGSCLGLPRVRGRDDRIESGPTP